jgi:hypothetical protein
LDVEADTVLLRDTLCVPVLHNVGVEVTEIVEEPDRVSEPVLQGEGVCVRKELADWEGLALLVSVPELQRDGVEEDVRLAEMLTDTVCDKLPVEQDVEDTDRLLVPLRLLLTVTLCVDVTETVPVIEGVKEELMEGELDWVEDRLLLIVPLTVLVPLLQ